MSEGRPPIEGVPRLSDVERAIILDAMSRYPGRKPELAAKLGISLKTLYSRLNQYARDQRAAPPPAPPGGRTGPA